MEGIGFERKKHNVVPIGYIDVLLVFLLDTVAALLYIFYHLYLMNVY